MSEYYKTLAGTWSRQTDGAIKGVVDATQTARSVAGSEADEKYEFHASVNINGGKAALIVNFSYSEDWEERYLEMVLDPGNNKVTLEAVVRNADGSEQSRTILASRDMTIELSTDYKCRAVSKEIATGVYGVYGFIDDFLVVEAEDLAAAFQKGMHGFECLGSEDDYSEFSYDAWFSVGYSTVREVQEALGMSAAETEYTLEIANCIESVDAEIDNALQNYTTVPLTSVPTEINTISKELAAIEFRMRKAPSGDAADALKKLRDLALEKLQAYIRETLLEGEGTFRVAEA